MRAVAVLLGAVLAVSAPAVTTPARAQQPPARPPAVGVVKVTSQPMTPATEFVGRIQAVERVSVVARVSAVLEKRQFVEGAEVKKGDLLYKLEQEPFQVDVQAKQAAIAQVRAQLQNAGTILTRQRTLMSSPAGQQARVDDATANQQSLQAQLAAAQSQLRQAEINLGYTEIRAPIDGRIGRTAVTAGNVVGPGSGVLTTLVSQDPMYVVFPVAARTALELRDRYRSRSAAVIKVRLPDGRMYARAGSLDFVDNTVAGTTDTITMRGVLPNPPTGGGAAGAEVTRELVDGALVTVVVEEAQPRMALTLPRAAVLTDQSGDYVYTVDAENKVVQQRIRIGQTLPAIVVVASGLNEGDSVIVDGIQRARPGIVVAPAPAEAAPGAAPSGTTPPRS